VSPAAQTYSSSEYAWTDEFSPDSGVAGTAAITGGVTGSTAALGPVAGVGAIRSGALPVAIGVAPPSVRVTLPPSTVALRTRAAGGAPGGVTPAPGSLVEDTGWRREASAAVVAPEPGTGAAGPLGWNSLTFSAPAPGAVALVGVGSGVTDFGAPPECPLSSAPLIAETGEEAVLSGIGDAGAGGGVGATPVLADGDGGAVGLTTVATPALPLGGTVSGWTVPSLSSAVAGGLAAPDFGPPAPGSGGPTNAGSGLTAPADSWSFVDADAEEVGSGAAPPLNGGVGVTAEGAGAADVASPMGVKGAGPTGDAVEDAGSGAGLTCTDTGDSVPVEAAAGDGEVGAGGGVGGATTPLVGGVGGSDGTAEAIGGVEGGGEGFGAFAFASCVPCFVSATATGGCSAAAGESPPPRIFSAATAPTRATNTHDTAIPALVSRVISRLLCLRGPRGRHRRETRVRARAGAASFMTTGYRSPKR
jgi:hypothetical protein